MESSGFIQYLGPPDLHDGTVVRAVHEADTATVVVRGSSGREYVITFDGVESFSAKNECNMMVYALSEMHHPPPLRRFVFVDSDDRDTVSLKVTARGIQIK